MKSLAFLGSWLVVISTYGCSGPDSQAHAGSAGKSASSAVGGGGSDNVAGRSAMGGSGGSAGSSYVVSMVQSPIAQALDLTTADIAALVGSAVSQAGGIDFIHDGQTVVLKPNLPTVYQDVGETLASPTVSGIKRGPLPVLDQSGSDYATSTKNMRLILAGRNAVAVDATLALVMKCDPKKVPHLTKLEADGRGTTDPARITVVGAQVSDVAKPFASRQTEICPGR